MTIKLSDKKLLVSIFLTLITTFGVSISVYASSTESTNTVSEELFNHETSLSPHIGTDVKLDHIIKELDRSNENDKEIIKGIQDNKLAICSIDSSKC